MCTEEQGRSSNLDAAVTEHFRLLIMHAMPGVLALNWNGTFLVGFVRAVDKENVMP